MKLSCDIVRDLLPSYVDGLVSGETVAAVETHVAGCTDCAEVLNNMRAPEQREQSEQREVDYLKKQRTRRWLFALVCVVVVLGGLLGAFCAWFVPNYVLGEELPASGYLKGALGTETAAVSYHVTVEDNVVTVNGVLLNGDGFARAKVTQENGVVQIDLYSAPKARFNSTAFQVTYAAEGEVEQVFVGEVIAWEDGITVSRAAADIYTQVRMEDTLELAEENIRYRRFWRVSRAAGFAERFLYRNPLFPELYPAISGTINRVDNEGNDLVNIPSVYGEQRLELVFEVGEIRTMANENGDYFRVEEMDELEGKLRELSVLLLAVLPELEEVQWTYIVRDPASDVAGGDYCYQHYDSYDCEWYVEYTVTAQEATLFMGQDIKTYGESAAGIQRLMEQINYPIPGLRQQLLASDQLAYEDLDTMRLFEMDTMYLSISCDTDVPLDRVGVRLYSNKSPAYEDAYFHLDGTPLVSGTLAEFEIPANVSEWEAGADYELSEDAWFTVVVTDEDGNAYNVGMQDALGTFGRSYYYTLRGDFENGFTLVPS